MRIKNVILLAVIACIGGVTFFFACKYTYESKLSVLKKTAKEAFVESVGQVVKSRNLKVPFSFYSDSKFLNVADVPDSVFWEDEYGKHSYRLDPQKHYMNITNNTHVRAMHSIIFRKDHLLPDSLNVIWKEYLSKSQIFNESALYIYITDEQGNASCLNTIQNRWCNPSNLMFTIYIGYACEIEVKGYIHCTVWSLIYIEIILFLLLCIIGVYIIYKICIVVSKKVSAMRQKEIVEVPIVKLVKEVNGTPIRSYVLHENIIFNAEQKKIEKNGYTKIIAAQSSHLLELFLQKKKEEYILNDSDIKKELWPDGSGDIYRIHKAITRLRSIIHEFDVSIEIIRGVETYQLLL